MAMQDTARIERGRYTEVAYLQYRGPRWLTIARAVAGMLTWPFVWPLALLCRTSDIVFRTVAELLSLIPYAIGIVVRAEFYRFALRHCGRNVVIEFGASFIYRDISIGDNVTINRFSVVHHCDIGSYVGVGEHAVLLSGSQQHNVDRTDIPIFMQQGRKKRIALGDDCWIGAHAVVMEDVGRGAVVGAGAIVTKPVAEFMIVAGNPARPLRRRGEPPSQPEAP
jgi:acetyltransferase-like isoleucine patch superfamily enzyme